MSDRGGAIREEEATFQADANDKVSKKSSEYTTSSIAQDDISTPPSSDADAASDKSKQQDISALDIPAEAVQIEKSSKVEESSLPFELAKALPPADTSANKLAVASRPQPRITSQDADSMFRSLQDENMQQKEMIDKLQEVIREKDKEIQEIRSLLSQNNDSQASEKYDGAATGGGLDSHSRRHTDSRDRRIQDRIESLKQAGKYINRPKIGTKDFV